MSSIHEFTCEAYTFSEYIQSRQATLEHVSKERYFAALKIQRVFRGYRVRRDIARCHQAATVLQKYVRRWLVIWHLPDIYLAYYEWYCEWYYNTMATRIQALWRGYLVRKDMIPPGEMLRRRLEMEAMNAAMQKNMADAIANAELEKMRQMDKEAEKWVLFILFKLHHLLRTKAVEGVYSTHNSKNLSPIEQLFKALPLKDYMMDVKKRYYKELGKNGPPPPYMFKEYVLRNLEDAYRKRDRRKETRPQPPPAEGIHKKPFILTRHLIKTPYKRDMFKSEFYRKTKFSIRETDPTKNVGDKDFDLDVYRKVDVPERPPPYHLDHWYKICEQHNLPD